MPRALIRSPSALKGVVEGNHHRSCRHKSCDQQPEETARHFAAAPAVPVEHAMVVREGRRLREAEDAQHRCDGAPGWCEDCACDEHQHMAEGRSREAGSERFQPGAHQLGPRLDGHGVISNTRHPVAWPIAWEVAMAARDREEILTRYRRLREVSTRHHSEALIPCSIIPDPASTFSIGPIRFLHTTSFDPADFGGSPWTNEVNFGTLFRSMQERAATWLAVVPVGGCEENRSAELAD